MESTENCDPAGGARYQTVRIAARAGYEAGAQLYRRCVSAGFGGRHGGPGCFRQAGRQLTSCRCTAWDMVAAFVLHGALDPALLYDVCQEMYFQYAKIQPHLAGFREKMNLPEWMRSIERVVEGSAEGRARLEIMRRNVERIARLRAQQAPG